jgi:Arc/MetJ-type ribon-helix-helix transcriptional regulator
LGAAKITITLEAGLLRTVDQWVRQGRYPNRSQAIQAALREKLERWKRTRFSEEFAKLKTKDEQRLADERFAGETGFKS